MAAISIHGTELYYVERGRGPTLVLLHAFPLDSRMWQAQAEALSDTYRVITPDFRGFGGSPSDPPFSIETMADDIHGLITALATGPVVLAGSSMGGYVTLTFSRKYPDALRALMLVDTKADADTTEGKAARQTMIDQVRAQGSKSIGDAMQPKLLSPDTVKNKPAIVKRLREMTDATSPLTIEHALEALRDRPDQTSLLLKIAVPTLIIVGDADSVTPPAVAEGMHRAIKGSEMALIRGAGHMAPMEQPEQVNAAMFKFLNRLR